MNPMIILSFITTRLSEPSTWAALSSALVALHVSINPSLLKDLTGFGIAAAVLLGYFIPETKK